MGNQELASACWGLLFSLAGPFLSHTKTFSSSADVKASAPWGYAASTPCTCTLGTPNSTHSYSAAQLHVADLCMAVGHPQHT